VYSKFLWFEIYHRRRRSRRHHHHQFKFLLQPCGGEGCKWTIAMFSSICLVLFVLISSSCFVISVFIYLLSFIIYCLHLFIVFIYLWSVKNNWSHPLLPYLLYMVIYYYYFIIIVIVVNARGKNDASATSTVCKAHNCLEWLYLSRFELITVT